MKRICAVFFLAIVFQIILNGEIQISESVTQFRYPKFSEQGFIEWVLEGNSGTYDQSDIAIEGLQLRIYSGDHLTRSLSNITGDNCVFDSDTQIATSDDSIFIKGSGFDLSGNQWTYDLFNEIISLNADASVRFSQNIDSIFSGVEQAGETTIKSKRMRLVIEPTRYLFRFEGDCTLSSEMFVLKSEILELELLNNSNKVSFSIPTGELSGMKSIEGEGDVEFIGMEQFIQSDHFRIQPQENKAIFEGKALIQYNQIVLKGDFIDWKQDLVKVLSLNNNLSSFSNAFDNDFYPNQEQPSSTFVQSKSISLIKQEDVYEYTFSEDVFYVSEFYRINAEWLYLKTNEVPGEDSSEMFQDIILTEAKDNVIVKHKDYQISGENLRYFPLEEQLSLRHEVTYLSDFAKLKSDYLIIENDILFTSSEQDLIEVVLPNTTDLNFELNDSQDTSELSTKNDTIVYANDLKITTLNSIYDCLFSGNVSLIKNDFSMSSDRLTMKWVPNADVTVSSAYAIDTMIAEGSAKMEQINYYASANYIEILPNEKMFHLLGGAHFKDNNGSLWGERIEFDRESKQTKVIGSKNGERARIQFDIFGTDEEENLEELEKE